ncbi:hypothetical protein ACTU3I_02695 [Microbacterium sp. RD1]|uniref:hypothetical protein n=1 Tax=Microbacterium sp. RD1 TaxID=3457313 RepID=UPI003FA59235
MSTDSRRARTRRRRARGFAATFAASLGVLVLVATVGAAVTVAQGPRITDVHVDPDAAVAASGARLILTTTQSLREVDAADVEVEPETPFTVDTSGRSVGLRFTLPLRDDTDYTVRIRDVRGVGAGPPATLEERFRTPALGMFLLQRGTDGDTISRTDLSGDATPVFTHDHIEDFRATGSHLVVAVQEDDRDRLLVTDLGGGHERDLPLPGDGFVSNLQTADRGERIGYTYSDAELGSGGGVESALFTASLAEGADGEAPTAVALPGEDARVAEWRFVPDTDSILALTFDGRLLLSAADGADAAPLGSAVGIEGIARGSSEAVVERPDAVAVIDLTDGSERTLVEPAEGAGVAGTVTPVPGEGAGTIRRFAEVSDTSAVLGTRVAHVGDDGAVSVLAEFGPDDAVLQTCVSPSGRYAALLIAPDAAANPYDRYRLPLPERLETRILEIATGDEVVGLGGFDVSWCQEPPS